jgi:hypothetical protein
METWSLLVKKDTSADGTDPQQPYGFLCNPMLIIIIIIIIIFFSK